MDNPIQLLLNIIEQPNAKKNYKEFKKYYESINKIDEKNAIQHLIEQRYANNQSSDAE